MPKKRQGREVETAELVCTVEEFNHFIGPKIRNHIQSMTKGPKKRLGNRCQRCHKVRAELDAAHVKEYDRKKVVAQVLRHHIVDKKRGIVRVDLHDVEEEIIEAHKPIEKHVILLCKPCHREYDRENRATARRQS